MGVATKYRVVRPHEGDKLYAVGDTRMMDSDDAAHLVPLTLQPMTVKAEKPPVNKALRAAPANKATRRKPNSIR